MRILLILVISTLLTACVSYPVYKTLQPKSTIVVLDSSGKPIAGAEVHLVASSHPHGKEKSRVVRITDNTGSLKFPSVKEWRRESLAIHGIEYFSWSWCIKKKGYETLQNGSKFQRKFTAKLEVGVSSDCPPGGTYAIHNKFKNESASKAGLDASSTR